MSLKLKKIKLAGFKSFVDPTVLELKGNLVAVLGPNGCGKSNIIDAVRWAMGESSVKDLRGAESTDVIFKGSSTRKPVGQASVELIFDNRDGRLGGEYANYAEISVRRQVNRDAESLYFLNNTRCRRKDINDIFLGTGLGPRSYSIIGQGMISRIIEARPEELRAFFEEAAGISLYKKRRHETEIRMRHTQENVDRLQDLNQEQAKQLNKLDQQAQSALQFQSLNQQLNDQEGALLCHRLQSLQKIQQKNALFISEKTGLLEGKLKEKLLCESQVESLRLSQTEKEHQFQVAQSGYYALNTEMARLEQRLEHHKKRKTQLEQDLEALMQELSVLDGQSEQDGRLQIEYQDQLNELETALVQAEAALEAARGACKATQTAEAALNQVWESNQQALHEAQKKADLENLKIDHLERQIRTAAQRIEKNQVAVAAMDLAVMEQALNDLNEQVLEEEVELKTVEGAFEGAVKQRDILISALEQLKQATHQADSQVKQWAARLDSLQELSRRDVRPSEDGADQTDSLVPRVFEQDFQTLKDKIKIKRAILEPLFESIFHSWLDAYCVPDLSGFYEYYQRCQTKKWIRATPVSASTQKPFKRLLDEIEALEPMAAEDSSIFKYLSLWDSIYVMADLQEARLEAERLLPHESIVVLSRDVEEGLLKSCLWLGPAWAHVLHWGEMADSEQASGLLTRKRLEQESQIALSAAQAELQIKVSELHDLSASVQDSQSELQKMDQALKVKRQACVQLKQTQLLETNQLQHARQEHHKLSLHIVEEQNTQTVLQEEWAAARMSLAQYIEDIESCSQKKARVQQERECLKGSALASQETLRLAQSKQHESSIEHKTLQAHQVAIETSLARLHERRKQVHARQAQLVQELADPQEEPLVVETQLAVLLSQHQTQEQVFTEARTAVQALEQELKVLEKQRDAADKELDHQRSQLQQLQLEQQAIVLRIQVVQDQLKDSNFEQASLNSDEGLRQSFDESAALREIERLRNAIHQLGPINMAAIEEYKMERERKEQLDHQLADLRAALGTLVEAIQKIDLETRTRFNQTFQQVGVAFQSLFPKLFGGGEAYLRLEGEDCLSAGVSVMARPPGKKNSSIQLLSGGEKALTAVALVFAIFQLNPAPFCMLDEVDAPLDEANVRRFCTLVKELSNAVQFIYITHNKLSMEMASHLSGVTMKEPGVSRLVSVDMEAARAMIEA